MQKPQTNDPKTITVPFETVIQTLNAAIQEHGSAAINIKDNVYSVVTPPVRSCEKRT